MPERSAVQSRITSIDGSPTSQELGRQAAAKGAEALRAALSISIRQIMRSTMLIHSVPDQRKAAAMRYTRYQPIDPWYPGTILREHTNAHLFLDARSAALGSLPT